MTNVDAPLGSYGSNWLHRHDHLRALAALAVFCWHATSRLTSSPTAPDFAPLALLAQGHVGVSLFCVISGFIFTVLYFETGARYRPFLIKRSARILPLLVFFIALTFYTSPEWTAINLVAMLLSTLNQNGIYGYAGPAWSVLIEIQFYLVFPFLIAFIKRYGLKYILMILAIFVIFRALVFLHLGTVQNLAYWTIFGRMDQFLLGVLAGLIHLRTATHEADQRQNLPALASFSTGLFLIAGFYHWFAQNGGYLLFRGETYPSHSGLWVFLPLIEAVCFASVVWGYASLAMPGFVPLKWLSIGLAYLGRISYSIYMTHTLVILAFSKYLTSWLTITSWEQALLLAIAVVFPATVAISSLTYFTVERPFMAMVRR